MQAKGTFDVSYLLYLLLG